MQTSFFCVALLSGTLGMAQSSSVQNQQWTTNVVGVAAGQTARLNVLYPTAPAPILQALCSVTLNIADDQGKILRTTTVSQLIGGKTVNLDVNADTDLAGSERTEIHGYVITPGCALTASLELIDNATQKTLLVTGSALTYPVAHLERSFPHP